MIRIFKEAYDVLHAYMIGKSRKNALYFAKYIDFFQTQFTQKVQIVYYVHSLLSLSIIPRVVPHSMYSCHMMTGPTK